MKNLEGHGFGVRSWLVGLTLLCACSQTNDVRCREDVDSGVPVEECEGYCTPLDTRENCGVCGLACEDDEVCASYHGTIQCVNPHVQQQCYPTSAFTVACPTVDGGTEILGEGASDAGAGRN
jgi:hypothetical protein